MDFYENVPAMQRFQYILKATDYKGVLEKDSRLDCAQLFSMKARKSVAVKAERVGHLTPEDEAKVLPLVASCGFIDAMYPLEWLTEDAVIKTVTNKP